MGQGPLLIGLTGYGQGEDRARGRGGVHYHLVKPADARTLSRLIEGRGRRDPE